MSMIHLREQLLARKLPVLNNGADHAATLRAQGVKVLDVQLQMNLPHGPFDAYGAPKSHVVANVFKQQEFEAHKTAMRARAGKHGLRRVSLTVQGLRRTSLENGELLSELASYQSEIEKKLDAQHARITLAKKASQVLMDFAKGRGQEELERRTSTSNLSHEIKASSRRWAKAKDASFKQARQVLLQREVAAAKSKIDAFEAKRSKTLSIN